VQRAAVYQSSSFHLACCLEFNSAVDLKPSDIQQCISFKLPKHMIPKEFYRVVCLPTLPSGKIDRQQLAGLKSNRLVDSDDHSAPPPSSVSAPLLAIWQAALHKNATQLDISFYDLGGDSLQLIDMILKIEETLGISVAQSRFMQEPTLRNLLNNFVNDPAIENNIELNDITIRYSDSMSLEALAALDWKQLFKVNNSSPQRPYALNVSQANALNDRSEFYFTYIHLQFSKDMDKAAFSRALAKLILRHEMLRTVLILPALQNAIDLRAELVLPVVHREEQPLSVSASLAMSMFSRMPLRLDTWPLFRWTLLQKGDVCHFIWQISHLICDLFGVDVLTRELVHSYAELGIGKPNSAATPAFSNRDYAAEIGSCLHYDESTVSHIESQLQGYRSAVESCKNHMRASGFTDEGFIAEKTLPAPLITSDSYFLLANYCLAIADCFELESVPIRAGTPGRSYAALTSNYFPLVTKGNDHYLFVVEQARASDSRSLAAELKERFKWYRDHSINFDKIIRVLRTAGRLIGPMSSIFSFGPLGKITCVADTNAGVKSLPRALWGLDSFHLQGHNALKIGLFTFQERDSVFVHLYSRGIAAVAFAAFCSAFEQRLRSIPPTGL
jgi:acyl carrier protein